MGVIDAMNKSLDEIVKEKKAQKKKTPMKFAGKKATPVKKGAVSVKKVTKVGSNFTYSHIYRLI
jgi:hypothetical protein